MNKKDIYNYDECEAWENEKLKNNFMSHELENWQKEFNEIKLQQKNFINNNKDLEWLILEYQKDKFANKINEELKRQRKIKLAAKVAESLLIGYFLINVGPEWYRLTWKFIWKTIQNGTYIIIIPLYFFLMEYIK